jgi:hypothetical protein
VCVVYNQTIVLYFYATRGKSRLILTRPLKKTAPHMKSTMFVETIDQDEGMQQEDHIGPAKAQHAIDCCFTNNTKVGQPPSCRH